jgi:hypothetical protein
MITRKCYVEVRAKVGEGGWYAVGSFTMRAGEDPAMLFVSDRPKYLILGMSEASALVVLINATGQAARVCDYHNLTPNE